MFAYPVNYAYLNKTTAFCSVSKFFDIDLMLLTCVINYFVFIVILMFALINFENTPDHNQPHIVKNCAVDNFVSV